MVILGEVRDDMRNALLVVLDGVTNERPKYLPNWEGRPRLCTIIFWLKRGRERLDVPLPGIAVEL